MAELADALALGASESNLVGGQLLSRPQYVWKGVRAVESARLESVYGCKAIMGSNPIPSALRQAQYVRELCLSKKLVWDEKFILSEFYESNGNPIPSALFTIDTFNKIVIITLNYV